MPEGVLQHPTLAELAEFNGDVQMHDIYQFFSNEITRRVANIAALPSSGNFVGRRIWVDDPGIGYVYKSTGWSSPLVVGGVLDSTINTAGTSAVAHGLGIVPAWATLTPYTSTSAQTPFEPVVFGLTDTQIRIRLKDVRTGGWADASQAFRLCWAAGRL